MTLTIRSALFSSISCLVIYLIFISQQRQGKPLSCEWFHKAEMEPAISAARRAKLTKTAHIMSRWLIIRRRMLQLSRWKRINKRFRAPRLPRGRAFHQLTSSSGGWRYSSGGEIEKRLGWLTGHSWVTGVGGGAAGGIIRLQTLHFEV